MVKYNFIFVLFVSLLFLTVSACTQSKEQEEFEKEAFSLPENITETGDNGAIVSGHSDPDDWRISPFFQGLVTIDPPFPNPLLTNQRLNLYIYITGLEAVNGIQIFGLYEDNRLRLLEDDFQGPLPIGSVYYSIGALEIAQLPENPQGLYRIIIRDRDGRIITYGDVRIE